MKVSSPEFTFDELTHTYKIKGRTVPSVTQVIKGVFGEYNNRLADWYMQRGSAIHQAIHLIIQNKLDWKTIDSRILGFIDSYQKFLKETGYKPYESEIRMFDRVFGFAGTADVVLLDDQDRLILGDFKSTIIPTVDIQLGGYSHLWHRKNRKLFQCCAIELSGIGNYKIRWVENIKQAEKLFLACLQIYNWKNQNNL